MTRTARVKRAESQGGMFAEVLVLEREAGSGTRDTTTIDGRKYLRARNWVVDAAGRRKRVTTYGKTEAELARKVKRLLETPAHNLEIAKMTIATYLTERYLPGAKTTVRATTYGTYETAVRSRIIPRIGSVKFTSFTADNARRWIAEMQEAEIGTRAIQVTVAVLKRAYGRATDDGVLSSNPIAHVKLPKSEAREIPYLTLTDANKLLGTTRDGQWGALLHLAIALGMRQAELLGLTWDRVNLAERFIDVRQQVVQGHGKQVTGGEGEGLSIGPVKTKASNRRVYLDDGSLRHLELIRAKQASKERLDPDLVFPSERLTIKQGKREGQIVGGDFIDRNNLTGRVLPTLLDRAEIARTTFHALRHTGASLLASQGVAESTIDRWLGHSNHSIGKRYIHAYDLDVQNCAKIMSTILAPVWATSWAISANSAPKKPGVRKEKTRRT